MIEALGQAREEQNRAIKLKKEEEMYVLKLKQKYDRRPPMSINQEVMRRERVYSNTERVLS